MPIEIADNSRSSTNEEEEAPQIVKHVSCCKYVDSIQQVFVNPNNNIAIERNSEVETKTEIQTGGAEKTERWRNCVKGFGIFHLN